MSTINDNNHLLIKLKALLQAKLWKLEEKLALEREKSPYKHLTEAQARILATLRGEDLSISEVGRRLSISWQAAHKIVNQLVEENILSLKPMPENNRDKIITFTEKGFLLKEAAKKALKKIDAEIKVKLGNKDFSHLKILLSKDWW